MVSVSFFTSSSDFGGMDGAAIDGTKTISVMYLKEVQQFWIITPRYSRGVQNHTFVVPPAFSSQILVPIQELESIFSQCQYWSVFFCLRNGLFYKGNI